MRTLVVFCAAVLVFSALTPVAGAEDQLILKDGSAITVDSMTVRGGLVEIRLPGSDRPVAYAVNDVDLDASGLIPEEAPTTFTTPKKTTRGGFEAAIAAPPGDSEGVTITDHDVEHVRPGRGDDEDGEEDEATPPARTTSLFVSNLQREVSPSGVLTVRGTVTNNGDTSVTAIAITGDAQDSGGASLGRGTTGISSTLAAGEAAEFSINIPVSGRVANVKVTAVAAMTEFSFDPVSSPQEDDDDEFADDFEEEFDEEPEDDFEE